MKDIRIDGQTHSALWTYRGTVGTELPFGHWTSQYWCDDGDGVELYIDPTNRSFELQCFSGIGASKISVDSIDFGLFWRRIDNVGINIMPVSNYTFEEQCVIISDYFCRLFCEYTDVSDYKTLEK